MIDVFLGFDVEDPIHPESDDAVLRLARDLADAGTPACFFLVGEKARVLRERGRRDVIAALAEHEIDYHGNYWFEFPEPAMVYGERLPWDQAVQRALEIELPGLHQVAEITGQLPAAWVQHQGNTSPQTAYALSLAGVPCWNGGFGGGGDPCWLMDHLVVSRAGHVLSLQGRVGEFQYDPIHSERTHTPCDPEEELAAFQRSFDALAEQNPTHINCLGHPTCWVTAEWWGWYEWGDLFHQGHATVPYPRGRQWERITLRSPRDSEDHFRWTKRAAQWLASRSDVRVTTFGQVAREHAEPRGAWLTRAKLAAVAERLAGRLDWVEAGETILSAADALYLLAYAVSFLFGNHRAPEEVQVMRVLGPVEPVLRPEGALALKRQDILSAARETYHHILDRGRLPAAIKGHAAEMGPAELARALAVAWDHLEKQGSLPERIEVPKGPGLPECAAEAFFRQPRVNSTNASAGFRSERIPELVRLQSWSYRPARRVVRS